MPVTVQASFGENGRCAASDRFGNWFHDDAGQRPLQRRPVEPRMRHVHHGGGTSDHPQIVGQCQPGPRRSAAPKPGPAAGTCAIIGCMVDQSLEFDGLAALVTGGASGIGLATARLLAGRGARVAVLDRIAADDDGTGLYPVVADVTDDAAVRAAVAEAGRALGRLDIVVNNAGIGAAGTVEDNDDAEWHRVLDVNVLGIVRVTRAALPLLRQAARERGQAAVVNTCSVAAIAGLPQRAVYSASKGAVYALTLAMAADHVAEGIRVTCVTPGTADTPWVGRLLDAAPDPAAERAALNARQPMGRLVSADEVAGAIAYLASPLAGATTGMALAVDGGMQGLRIRPRPA
jgi:2-keto-3-deoxy-L-fuconate dehydrogenase